MLVGLNNLRNKLQGLYVHCLCRCMVCIGNGEGICCIHEPTFKRTTLIWEACVCLKGEFDVWHRLECLVGDCTTTKSMFYDCKI